MISTIRRFATLVVCAAAVGLASCSDSTDPVDEPVLPDTPFTLTVAGNGRVNDRFTAELWVSGQYAYTTTWGTRTSGGVSRRGDKINIWSLSGNVPVLVDSVIVSDATTLGDVQVTTDGKYMVVATEFAPGSIVIYDLANPQKPLQIARFQNADTDPGVHTAEIQVVNGKLYGFLSIDPRSSTNTLAKLVIVDLSNPAAPAQVLARTMGTPFVHDVYVRDGIMMTALWNDGLTIWDIGGGGKGGSPSNPIQMSNVKTVGGKAHNIVWFHDAVTNSKKYAFVGEEGPGAIGSSSVGDVHVVDVSNLSAPVEVAVFSEPNAGVHNFSADEQRGILYLAYYNGGVRALSTRGDLSHCTAAQKATDGRCDLNKMKHELAHGLLETGGPIYVWGVQFVNGSVYASDMLNGIWKMSPVPAF
ncbi:MAG TPA: hypothetical protein VM053_11665 [Gemmatimonadaceae bacterium]|nr:hypothetical protein [Gemmatimonadaceae bacterium]